MRACIQRVTRAQVSVDERVIGSIGEGLVVLLGVARQDSQADVDYMVNKITQLRIFPDDDGKMNRSLLDAGGQMLVVSQFTLLGDARKGRRPSFIAAADTAEGNAWYEQFVQQVRALGVEVATGKFQAHMLVELVNDGPVTLLVDSDKTF